MVVCGRLEFVEWKGGGVVDEVEYAELVAGEL